MLVVHKPAPPIATIRSVITELLPMGHPALETVAEKLEISPRTLQRRLAEVGMTHRRLVTQSRLQRACQLLSRNNTNIKSIARELGFATPSSFSRAFQSWTGTSPRLFRQEIN